MKNRKSILIILLAGTLIPCIQSCKKYPEGPAISIHSKTARVANTWNVEKYLVNGSYIILPADYTETFTKEGNYYFTFGNLSGTGIWEFQNNDREIRITAIDHQSSETLYILKLEEKQFWYFYLDGNDRHEFHMFQD